MGKNVNPHGYTLLEDDPQKCREIEELYSAGLSQAEIVSRTNVAIGTLCTVLRRAREQGRCPTLRDRLLEYAMESAMSAVDKARELRRTIAAGTSAAMVAAVASYEKATWIGVGILSDKLASTTPQINVTAGPGGVVNVLNDYSARLTQIGQTPSQSAPSTQPIVVTEPAREYNTRQLPAISADIAARL